ncbi:MAG: 4Fe-4S ferredoxin, partial [Clostridia bacterium]|nr:4Fe-4S ferredoxin [Clostridia bacterium]
IMCGLCSSRCPAGISHPQVAILARRLYGKYIAPECAHLLERVAEINEGKHDESMNEIMNKSLEEQKALYNSRDIEK